MRAEAAALRLGTTVARAAARAWLGGKRREQARHMSMAELVRLRVSGLRLQRSVQRPFEEIADAVFGREPGGGRAPGDGFGASAGRTERARPWARRSPGILERLPDRSLFAPEGTDRDGEFRRRYHLPGAEVTIL
ncbi:hypothetical protein [Streptomyces sp. TRM68367]|uniref:NACHT N-terminal Helical domain 1-containing protein n=1 Tax=Streptomyces sp. TRM68367 TaxID=2758415 RepID=UPI00165CBFF6|nr:hypothetical protein [Streptomyces sp. TRM68367]MBC9723515.1 hypothetical protein [Streptomyces sp. TRM68367]